MHCDELVKLLAPYLEERLDDSRRAELRQHLRSCQSCRNRALEQEPTLLLALAPPPEMASRRTEAVAAAVMAQIRGRRLERRLDRRRRPWLAVAAAAALVVGGAAVWRAAVSPPAPIAGAPAAVGASLEAEPPRAEVEVGGAGVRVYEFADQYGHSDQAVYYVVNPALEL